MSNKEFLNCGYKKIIIVNALMGNYTFNYHHNIFISNDTPFHIYYNKVKGIINTHYEDGYRVDKVPKFKISVWNMDNLANKNIKITKPLVKNKILGVRGYHTNNVINPLKSDFIVEGVLSAMDIETVK